VHNPDHLLSVNDVYNVIAEHMIALDTLWPDGEAPPRKVHVVELIDGIKLKLAAMAEKNANRYESPFESAARRVTGHAKIPLRDERPPPPQDTGTKSAMQLAHEAAKARMKPS
jgi:hypothetical protein